MSMAIRVGAPDLLAINSRRMFIGFYVPFRVVGRDGCNFGDEVPGSELFGNDPLQGEQSGSEQSDRSQCDLNATYLGHLLGPSRLLAYPRCKTVIDILTS